MRTPTLPRQRFAGRAAAAAAVATGTAARLTPVAAEAVTPASGPDTGGTRIETPAPGVSSAVTSVASGLYFTLELDSDGSVWSLGDGTLGELGDGTTTRAQLTPVRVEGLPPIAEVEAGDRFAIVRGVDGSVWTWGLGSSGQLGIDDTANQTRPVEVTALADRDIIDVGAGSVHSMAVASDGTVWAWGSGLGDQLGTGDRQQQNLPVQVPLPVPASRVASKYLTSFAVGVDGSLWGWGDNSYGEVGEGTAMRQPTPTNVTTLAGVPVKDVDPSFQATTVLTEAGAVWTWGRGSNLGDGNTVRRQPTPVPALDGVVVDEIATGEAHSLARTIDGRVFTWGYNSNGQIGDGTTAMRPLPTDITGFSSAPVIAVAAGRSHSFALTTDGELFGFGNNQSGQLGIGVNGNTERTPTRSDTVPLSPVGVSFDGIAGTDIAVPSPGLVAATTPPHAVGLVDVIVTTAWSSGVQSGAPVYTTPQAFEYIRTAAAASSTIEATPVEIPADGTSESSVIVSLLGSDGIPLEVGGDTVVLSASLGALSEVIDNGDGTYGATLTAGSTPGEATVAFSVNGVAGDATAVVTFSVVDQGPGDDDGGPGAGDTGSGSGDTGSGSDGSGIGTSAASNGLADTGTGWTIGAITAALLALLGGGALLIIRRLRPAHRS